MSTDYIGNPHSCILDAKSTNVVDGTLVKVSGWYDNEWGYASRCVDLLRFIGKHALSGRMNKKTVRDLADGAAPRQARARARGLQRAARRRRAGHRRHAHPRGAADDRAAARARRARRAALAPRPAEGQARSRSTRSQPVAKRLAELLPDAKVHVRRDAPTPTRRSKATHDARRRRGPAAREHALPRRRGDERRRARRARSPSSATST